MKYKIDFEPIGRRGEGAEGDSLLEVARQAGVGLVSICGGKGTCGRCRVQVLSGSVSPLNEVEKKALTPTEQAKGCRLACQVRIKSNVKVHVPPDSLTTAQRIQTEGQELQVAVNPVVESYQAQLPPPTRTDLRADATRLTDHLAERYGLQELSIDHELLRQLSPRLREAGWKTTVTLRGREIVNMGAMGRTRLGLAVDLGTTKLAGYLVDLEGGETLAAMGAMNPQIAYGEDVMARITYAMEGADQADTLQQIVVDGLNDLARQLCAQAGRDPTEIDEAVVVGNTAMHHLFLGLPVRQLGLAPYLAAVSAPLDAKARDIGLALAPGAYVHLLANIAGFVGADHVAMLLATGIYETDKIVAGLDIGTNTEIALKAGERLITCSTASGPAFEGAHIKDGMRAAQGAIESLRIVDSRVEYHTIGHVPPVGLCGSGILDAVAQLYQAGIIDRRGTMDSDHARVRSTEDGKEFVLVDKEESGNGREIVLTRRDVGEIQLAKGAMRAGLNILLAETGLEAADLDEIIIAGAFGTYINVDSAISIGMFPPLPLERFKQVGNAAGMGAKLALISREQRARAEDIAQRAEYIELTNDPRFVTEFSTAMFLA